METMAFSPQRTKSFRHFLLLPSPAFVCHGRKSANLRVSLGAGAAQLQASGLRVRGHAGACPPSGQRTGRGYTGRCAEVAEARSIAALDQRSRAFLAKAVLRFQHSQLPTVCRKATLHSSQSGVPSEPAFGLLGWKPVKAGLCERPEDWDWSSFRHNATGCEGRVEIESEWAAQNATEQREDFVPP
jgi:hypothetical protein